MMPTRADWLAATPKCERLHGPLSRRVPCDKPLAWVYMQDDSTNGAWCCGVHGPMLSGFEAAVRAGFLHVATVALEEAA